MFLSVTTSVFRGVTPRLLATVKEGPGGDQIADFISEVVDEPCIVVGVCPIMPSVPTKGKPRGQRKGAIHWCMSNAQAGACLAKHMPACTQRSKNSSVQFPKFR